MKNKFFTQQVCVCALLDSKLDSCAKSSAEMRKIMYLDLYNRFFRPLLFRTLLKSAEKKAEKCEMCKGKMVDTTAYLYLIPAKFGEEHEESAEYYIKNAVKIDSTEQIPNGNRACRMFIFQCQSCGHKKVSVVDFLKVRENELVKGGDIYPYEKFREFFNNN